MSDEKNEITDLTRGVYRRQYAGFVGGKRINRLSLEAEAWFWRVHAACDDFGNLPADESLLYGATIGRRAGSVSIDRVGELVDEMIDVELLKAFEVAGDRYLHVVGFLALQPSGKNGKRVRRVPSSPWEGGGNGPAPRHGAGEGTAGTASEPAPVNPGESNGIQNDPGVPSATHSHSDSDPDAQQAKLAAGGASTASGGGTPAPPATDVVVMTFPCDGAEKAWTLRESGVAKARERFPTLDILAEFRAALAFVEDSPSKRKTSSGMPRFLTRWLTESQNNPRRRARPNESLPPAGGPSRRAFGNVEPAHAPNTTTKAQTDADLARERQATDALAVERARVDTALSTYDALSLDQLKRDVMESLGPAGAAYARSDPRTAPGLRGAIANMLARRGVAAA